MSELLDLAARCEAAEGPDRAMDARIWWETYGQHRKADDRLSWQRNPASAASRYWPGWEKRDEIPHFTASLDAAMTLVPEGHTVNAEFGGGLQYAAVWPDTPDWHGDCSNHEARAATPALALCAAALRARAATPSPNALPQPLEDVG